MSPLQIRQVTPRQINKEKQMSQNQNTHWPKIDLGMTLITGNSKKATRKSDSVTVDRKIKSGFGIL